MLTPHQVTFEQYTQAIMGGNTTHARMSALNQNVVFTDGDIESTGLTLTSYLNSEEDLTMGRAVMDELNISLFRGSKTSNLNWGDEFKLDMGVEIEGTTYWETVGYYCGKKPERSVTDGVIRFQLVDRMSKLEIPADDYLRTLDWTEGVTIAELYHGICTYCGVQWEAGNELANIMNRGYVTAMMVGNGYTCREVIAWIAEACGCYARFGASGKMKMVWFQDHMDDYMVYRSHEFSIYVSEIESITDPSQKKKWADLEMYTWSELSGYLWAEMEGTVAPFKILALNVRQMEEDAGVVIPSAANHGVYMIVDNPFLMTANATEETNYLWPIYERLSGFGSYIPMSVECTGNWLIEPGDIISVEVGRGNQVKCPIFTREFRWNGGARDVYEATGNLEREIVSAYTNRKMVEGGRMHVVKQTVDEMYERIQDTLGNYSTHQQTADAIALAVAKTSVVLYDTVAPTGINRDADIYSNQRTYEEGDYCLHAGKSWRCVTAITVPENWTDAHWTVDQNPLTEETIWVDISDYLQTEADEYDSTETYAAGELCEYGGSVYRCVTAITTPEAWTAAHWELYESPVPKNEWHRWNGTAWEAVSENTTYTRQSGIEITADGVTINGDKYVKIQANDEGVWTYDERGLSYIGTERASTFRFGQTSTEGIEAAANAGVFDYRHTESGDIHNAIKMNSTIAQWDSSIQNWRYTQSLIYWETVWMSDASTYVGALRPRIDSTGMIGKPGYYWARSYIYDMYGARMTLTGNFSAGGSVTAGSASFTGAVLAGSGSVSGNATVSGVFTAGNVQSAIYRTDGTTMEFIPYYNEAPTQKGYHRAILWKPIDNAIHALTFCPNHASDDTYLYLGLPARQIKRLYTEASPVVGSSRKIKHDIRKIGEVGDLIDRLKPSTFIYDMDADEKVHSGFIYEEVEGIFPTMCDDSNGGVGLALDELIPYLTREIQSLRKRVAELENKEG